MVVGQSIRRYSEWVKAEHLGAFGQIRAHLSDNALGVEGSDKYGARTAAREICDRPRSAAEDGTADTRDLLDVDAGNFDLMQIVERTEGLKGAARIVNSDRGVARELVYKSSR
ncbi:MAG: hypothetical protein JOZ11_20700, partial [Alphaproteobacteria bacterium]|nr:hypothetical protein [Alphaproteobacteria bacterium]